MTWAGRPGSARCRSATTGPPFAADWEARVYALATVLRRRGLFNSDELRDAIERLPPEEYLAASYYERWLGAIEMLVTEKGPEMGPETGPEMGTAP